MGRIVVVDRDHLCSGQFDSGREAELQVTR